MSAMERLKVWLNQKTAKILGDFQEPEPVEDPSPTRAGCRILFMVSLLVGFSLLLVYTFNDAPDARVVQMHHLTPGGKNRAFPSCFLYDRNSTDCKKWSTAEFPMDIPVSCPCKNTSAPWKNFVKFHALHENSTVWNITFTKESPSGQFPYITLPDDTIRLGNENIEIDKQDLTAEKFCNLSYLWPNSRDSSGTVVYEAVYVKEERSWFTICVWMATLLFPGSNTFYEDRTRGTQFLNTPNLLNREGLNTLLAQLARESVLRRRLVLDMALSLDAGNGDFRRSYNALARLLTDLLDRKEMDPSQSYIYGASKFSLTLYSNQGYDSNTTVWYLEDDSGPIFLQPQIDWEAYRQTCNPIYCEVTQPMRRPWKFYWALGILGGVATIAFAVVTMLLWPCTAMLLIWISKRKTAATGDPARPVGPLLHDPSL